MCWFTNIETWEKIIIPLLSPALTFIGALWILRLEFKDRDKKEQERRKHILLAMKASMTDNLQLGISLIRGHLEGIVAMTEDISFEKFKSLRTSIFENEGLSIVNSYTKTDFDAAYNRPSISDTEKLLCYAQFLSSRTLLMKMYENLNTWPHSYQLRHSEILLKFDNATLRFLYYLENQVFLQQYDNFVILQFQNFLKNHQEFSDHPSRFNHESEVLVIKNLLDDLVKTLDSQGILYTLEGFSSHYLSLEITINEIKRFAESNQGFLKSLQQNIKSHLEHLIKFNQVFNSHLCQS